jgi:putative ABC transport system substrate-binding protein
MNRKPVVFASVGDPTLSGLIPVPGSQDNFTGGNNRQTDQAVVTQRVDYMLSDPLFQGPFAIVGNYINPISRVAMDLAFNYLTRQRGQQAQIFSITPADNIASRVADMKNARMLSMYVCSDFFLTVNSTDLNREAHRNPNPMRTIFEFEEHQLGHGGDDYYGSDFKELFETAAHYVDEILDGARPSDLPIYIARLRGRRPWPIIARSKTKASSRKKK